MKKSNAVHPVNAGPGFQIIMRQPKGTGGVFPGTGEYDDMLFHNGNDPGPKYTAYPSGKAQPEPEVPKGLEALVHLEHLFVRQSLLVTEFFFNVSNKFEILNSSGDFIYLAAETTPPLTRIFCFGGHPFEMTINSLPGPCTYSWNAKGKEVLKLNGSTGSCGCGSEVTVTHGRKSLGTIEQEGDCMNPVYSIRNTEDKEVVRIEAPSKSGCLPCGFRTLNAKRSRDTLQFDIFEPGGSRPVGRIARQYEVVDRDQKAEAGKDLESELWGAKFPRGMDVDTKGLLLSAVFLFVRLREVLSKKG